MQLLMADTPENMMGDFIHVNSGTIHDQLA